MDLPLGYKTMGVSTKRECLVYCLHKSIYGVKQASKQWFAKFTVVLTTLEFQQFKADYSLFIRGTREDFVVLLVYVDDIIITKAN